jgi:tungstate transport system substrate-binding protein
MTSTSPDRISNEHLRASASSAAQESPRLSSTVCGSLIIAALAVFGCGPPSTLTPYLDVATTTSVQNSGLLNDLLPLFISESGVKVRVHAAGSGRALEMLADGIVDLVISHAPAAERRYLDRHPSTVYRKVAYNWFIVVGPEHDPAVVRDSTDVVDAFRRMAAAPVPFVSRGDNSGTHERELELWELTGTKPPADRLIISGRGMALALRHADELSAYTLSDEATFLQLASGLRLVVLFRGDARLLNTYAVVHGADNSNARLLAQWLTAGPGRQRIRAYRATGQAVFSVWPDGCPADTPAASPCR